MGDNVCPEENFVYIIYTGNITTGKMIKSVKSIKKSSILKESKYLKIFKIIYDDVEL